MKLPNLRNERAMLKKLKKKSLKKTKQIVKNKIKYSRKADFRVGFFTLNRA